MVGVALWDIVCDFVGSDLEKDRIDGDTPVIRKWDTMGGHGACGVILLESAI